MKLKDLGGRSIPTRVGTTGQRDRGNARRPVHPHACGDYGRLGLELHGQQRSIPTRVGTTPPPSPGPTPNSVHPHACGDYESLTLQVRNPPVHPHACGDYILQASRHMARHGPSPRVWGLLGAGATRLQPRGVHPHACGDYCLLMSSVSALIGPSPRVWGLRKAGRSPPGDHRSIPTRVGTTGRPSPGLWKQTVHPHACGDYAVSTSASR